MSTRSRRALSKVLSKVTLLGVVLACLLQGLQAVVASEPASASASWSLAVSDTFHRTTRSGLGRAPRGGTYGKVWMGSHVSGGQAVIGPLWGRQSITAVLPSATGSDELMRATFVVPAAAKWGYGTFLSVMLRRQANGSAYVARLRVGLGGILRLSIGKFVAHGGWVNLTGEVAVPGRARPGQVVAIDAQVTGQDAPTVLTRGFFVGHRPPNWQMSATDRNPGPLAGSGSFGIYLYRDAGSPHAVIVVRSLTGYTRPPVRPAQANPPHVTPPPAPPVTTPPVTTPPVTTPPVTTPPVTTPPVTTPPVTSGSGASTTVASAGSVPLGQATYALAANALYVSPSGSDAYGTGSVSAPFATIGRALSAVGDGGTVVLRAGTYNESLFVGKQVTIEGYPGEVAWMDGSVPVSSWTRSGSTWVHSGWTYQFDHSASFQTGSDAGGYVNPAHPMAAWPDQVFMDGAQLAQVASAPGPGQFAVDYAAHTLTIGSDPTGHAMRASTLSTALTVGAGNVTLRGFGVRGYATSLPQMGTVYLGGSTGHDLVQNMVIRDNATQGISVYTHDVRIDHIDSWNNGMTGIHATASPNLVISGTDLRGNNTQLFNSGPSAGGIKVGRMDGVTIVNNWVHDNYGITGIWTDENVTDFNIANNVVDVGSYGGSEYGILTELSDTGIVAGNIISHAQYGYTAFDTGHVQVYNNTLLANSTWDIGLSQDDRYLPGHSTATVNPLPNCPWVVQGVTVADNDFGNSTATYEFYALDKATSRPADSMGISLAGNRFLDRTGSSGPWPIGWGNGDIWTPTNYATVRAWEVAHSYPVLNSSVSAGSSALATTATSVLVGDPSPVAALLGVPTGTRNLGAF